jgi:hypothetical protein
MQLSTIEPKFTGQLTVAPINHDWRIVSSVLFQTTIDPETLKTTNQYINIYPPTDFITDFASIPRFFWVLLPPYHPDYSLACVIHDYCYDYSVNSKAWADKVFLQALTTLKCPWYKKYPMYWAVRIGGKGNYKVPV